MRSLPTWKGMRTAVGRAGGDLDDEPAAAISRSAASSVTTRPSIGLAAQGAQPRPEQWSCGPSERGTTAQAASARRGEQDEARHGASS